MKSNKFIMMGVLAVLLTFGLVMAGCGLIGNDDDDDDGGFDRDLVAKWHSTQAAADSGSGVVFEITAEGIFTGASFTAGEIKATTSGGRISATATVNGTTVDYGAADYVVNGTRLTFSNMSSGQPNIFTQLNNIVNSSLPGLTGSFYKKAGSNDLGGKSDEYELIWIARNYVTYAQFIGSFPGVTLTPAGSNAGYLTGNAAYNAFVSFSSSDYQFNDSGTEEDSFENLLNFKQNGIGLPSALRSALSTQKANVPIIGVFQSSDGQGGYGVIAFYVTTLSDQVSEETETLLPDGWVKVQVPLPGDEARDGVAITVGFNPIRISGSDGSNVLYKSGSPSSLSLSAEGGTNVGWYVDGGSKISSDTLTISAYDYDVRVHSVTFVGYRNGAPYSQVIPFTVLD
jgi:hypothetical protein